MRTIEQIQKEYSELNQQKIKYIQEADKIAVEMVRLEGMAQLLTEDKKEEPVVEPVLEQSEVIEGEVVEESK